MSVHGLTPRDFTNDWRKVQAKLDQLWAEKRNDAAIQVIRDAIKATSNLDWKDSDELENIASYHAQLTNGACECAACGAFYRMEGVW